MAFLTFQHVRLEGIASCVPKEKQLVSECECLTLEEAKKLSASTGIYERRISEQSVTSSDLCLAAAEKIISDLEWEKSTIEALIFVTQTPDYILPATSPILQNRLGLPLTCLTLDISLGCSGYVYGLTQIASLLSSGSIKRALLLVGDTISKLCSPMDKSTFPLFGDAGTATALSFDLSAKPMYANLLSDGSGYSSIRVKDGGARFPISSESLELSDISEGIKRNACHIDLNGMDVFSFGISKAPSVVTELLSKVGLSGSKIDYFIFHQANKMMNDKIQKKLALNDQQVPSSLGLFGNTSCATIPLTLNTCLNHSSNRNLRLVLCGFGVGLSWGAIYLEVPNLILSSLTEL